MIVLEFMPNGDLRDFLIRNRPRYEYAFAMTMTTNSHGYALSQAVSHIQRGTSLRVGATGWLHSM